jgi:hypothetical protein
MFASPVQKTALGLQRIRNTLTRQKLREAGQELIQRRAQGQIGPEALAEISQKYQLGPEGTAVLVDLMRKSRAIAAPATMETPLGTVPTEQGPAAYSAAARWQSANAPAQPEPSPQMQRFMELRSLFPNMTPKERRQLAYGKLPGESERQMTPEKAMDEIVQLQEAVAKFGKEDTLTKLLGALYPQMKQQQQVDDRQKQSFLTWAQRRIDYLKKFVPEGFGGGERSGSPTYRFSPDKGFQRVD